MRLDMFLQAHFFTMLIEQKTRWSDCKS